MNVQPINKINYKNKEKTTFKGYTSTINVTLLEKTFLQHSTLASFQIPFSIIKWMKTLERMEKAYAKDKFVDVRTYISRENIWAQVKPAKGRESDDSSGVDISQCITIEPEKMEKCVMDFATKIRTQLTKGLKAV